MTAATIGSAGTVYRPRVSRAWVSDAVAVVVIYEKNSAANTLRPPPVAELQQCLQTKPATVRFQPARERVMPRKRARGIRRSQR